MERTPEWLDGELALRGTCGQSEIREVAAVRRQGRRLWPQPTTPSLQSCSNALPVPRPT